MITFRRMIYLLIAIIVFLCLTIVVLSVNFRKAQLSHNQKINELQYLVVQLSADGDNTLSKLKMSDDLREKLHFAREKIDRDLMLMQHGFIETLSKNNLIT